MLNHDTVIVHERFTTKAVISSSLLINHVNHSSLTNLLTFQEAPRQWLELKHGSNCLCCLCEFSGTESVFWYTLKSFSFYWLPWLLFQHSNWISKASLFFLKIVLFFCDLDFSLYSCICVICLQSCDSEYNMDSPHLKRQSSAEYWREGPRIAWNKSMMSPANRYTAWRSKVTTCRLEVQVSSIK